VEARAKRVEKESAQEAKGKSRRGRKPKSNPPDPPEAEEGTADTARRGKFIYSNILRLLYSFRAQLGGTKALRYTVMDVTSAHLLWCLYIQIY
jgi:hypothetical protein